MDERLLKILACPKCKGDLKYDGKETLTCEKCDDFYIIESGIPKLMPKKK